MSNQDRYTAVRLFEGKEYRLEAILCAGLTQSKQLAVLYKEMLKTGSLPRALLGHPSSGVFVNSNGMQTEMEALLTDAHLLGSAT